MLVSDYITSKTVAIQPGVEVGECEQLETIHMYNVSPVIQIFPVSHWISDMGSTLILPTQYNTNGTVYFMPSTLYYFDNFTLE